MEATDFLSKYLTEASLDGGFFTPLETDWIYRFAVSNGGKYRKEKLSGFKRIYINFSENSITHVYLNKKKDSSFEVSGDISGRFKTFDKLKEFLEREV